MAQIIKHRRGTLAELNGVTLNNGELGVVTSSVSNIGDSTLKTAVVVGHTDGTNRLSIGRIITGNATPDLSGVTGGSAFNDMLYHETDAKTLLVLNTGGNTNLDLTGNIADRTVGGTLTTTGNVSVQANISASGNVTASNIYASGNIHAVGDITFEGGSSGTIKLGDSSGDNLVIGADISSSLIPNNDNEFDLGSSGQEWKDLYIDGTANIDTLSADTAAIGDLTNNRVVIAGTSGELEDDGNFTFDGSTLTLGTAADFNSTLDVQGVADFQARVDAQSGLDVTGSLNTSGQISGLGGLSLENFSVADSSGNTDIDGTLDVEGVSDFQARVDAQAGLDVTGSLGLQGATATRLLSTNGSKVVVSSDLASWVTGTTNQVTVTDDSDGTITLSIPQDIHTGANPTFAGVNAGNINVGITGDNEIDTDSGNLTLDSSGGEVIVDDILRVTGNAQLSGSLLIEDDSAAITHEGATSLTISSTSGTVVVEGSTFNGNNLTVPGNLTVNGTTTQIDSTTLNIGDNIVVLNSAGAASDGGIQVIDAVSTAHTGSFLWNATNDYWYSGISGSTHYRIPQQAGASALTENRPVIADGNGRIESSANITDNGTTVDFNDVDLTSVDKLEGVDSNTYIDIGSSGVVETKGTVQPSANGGNDLGATGTRYANLYLSSNADVDGTLDVQGVADFQSRVDAQSSLQVTGSVYVSTGASVASGSSVAFQVPSSTQLGYLGSGDTQAVTTGLVGYNASTGVLTVSSVIDGGQF